MIYHFSLHTAGVIAGAFLVVVGVLGLIKPDFAQVVKQFPRSRVAGIVLLTICAGLDLVVARHHPDGRIRQLPSSAPDRFTNRLRAHAVFRG